MSQEPNSTQTFARLNREGDPVGTESATEREFIPPSFKDENERALELQTTLRSACEAAMRPEIAELCEGDVVKQMAFVRGYLFARGWNLDINDAILVVLMDVERAGAL